MKYTIIPVIIMFVCFGWISAHEQEDYGPLGTIKNLVHSNRGVIAEVGGLTINGEPIYVDVTELYFPHHKNDHRMVMKMLDRQNALENKIERMEADIWNLYSRQDTHFMGHKDR